MVAALAGAQTAALADTRLVGHLLTAGVAAGGLAVHVRTRTWPALAGGVAAAALLVAEVTHDLAGATLAVAVAVVLAGLALVLVSALGLLRGAAASTPGGARPARRRTVSRR